MKISFEAQNTQQTKTSHMESHKSQTCGSRIYENRAYENRAGSAYRATLSAQDAPDWQDRSKKNGKGKTLQEIQQEAGYTDVSVKQDYMTLMSNTMSAEDYARMEKEGFSFRRMDPETTVTIVDKIKAELKRSGQEIVGYTDDVDMETLAAAVGSETLAQAITDSFAQADVPLTEENLEKTIQAWNMASGLSAPGEGEYRYMLDNGMEPDIYDFYMAENSGAGKGETPGGVRYYAEEIEGYYTENASKEPLDGLEEQVDRVIRQAELPVDEENRKAAKWLLQKEIPLTAENMVRFQELKAVTFPVTEEQFAKAAACAVAEGKTPGEGKLSQSENIYDIAVNTMKYYFSEEVGQGMELSARRLLEEVRLRMTAEVNVKLLRSGFAIDTAPMEELIEALKQAEAEVSGQYFPQEEQAVSKYREYRQTCQVVEEIPFLPAQVLGTLGEATELGIFHESGTAIRDTLRKANESYETLMTSPRADMGDSIQKAFANVDDILADLGIEATESSRKAVRILGYNRMEVTPENIARVQAAEKQVQSVVEKMTPAATLQMIRDGINPLEQTFEELEMYFQEQPKDEGEEMESYSRFLYRLEQNSEITETQRSAYIGIYRLLHQVEKADGAAVGALVDSQAELTFHNLLTAVRTKKAKHMDIRVDDATGTLTGLVQKGVSISDQIAQGYGKAWQTILTDVSYSEEAEKNYYKQEMQTLQEAARAEAECVQMLQRGDIPVTVEHLLAAKAWSGGKGEILERWNKKTADSLLNQLEDEDTFQESYQEMLDDIGEDVTETGIQTADTSMDVKALQLSHKQLYIAGQLAKQEEYFIPLYLDDEMTTVHLTMRHSEENQGRVEISMEMENAHIEGEFTVSGGSVQGLFAGNTQEAVRKLQAAADIFNSSVPEEWDVKSIQVIETVDKDGIGKSMEAGEPGKAADNGELYRLAKIFLQSVKTGWAGSEKAAR